MQSIIPKAVGGKFGSHSKRQYRDSMNYLWDPLSKKNYLARPPKKHGMFRDVPNKNHNNFVFVE